MDTLVGNPAFHSVTFAQRMAVARALLAKPRRSSGVLPALAAAGLFAFTSMAFVAVVILVPTPFSNSR